MPDSKTGAKTIPLNEPALEVLADAKRAEGNPYVIVGTRESAYLTDLQKPWRRVRKADELEDVCIHDLRHTFASRALALGEGLPMIGRLLGHRRVETTARYAHLARDFGEGIRRAHRRQHCRRYTVEIPYPSPTTPSRRTFRLLDLASAHQVLPLAHERRPDCQTGHTAVQEQSDPTSTAKELASKGLDPGPRHRAVAATVRAAQSAD